MTKCPLCFTQLDVHISAFACDHCPASPDRVAGSFQDKTIENPSISRWDGVPEQKERITSGICGVCRRPVSRQVCPTCHFLLPAGWFKAEATCVAMAGARNSGKSIYIAVLKQQAEELAARTRGTFTSLDTATQKTFEELYETPLFINRGIIDATLPLDRIPAAPLIFSLGGKRKPRYLVIRDVAGENLQKPLDERSFGFLRNADMVLFLFDPLAIGSVRHMLAGVIPALPEPSNVATPLAVLSNMIQVMRAGGEGKVTTPLAVALSKFDALQELAGVDANKWNSIMSNTGAAFLRDRSLDGSEYDDADGALLHEEVASLLLALDGADMLNLISEVFADFRLFALSALGQTPNGKKLQPQGIAPFRVLDPLKWAMSRTSGR